MYTNIGIRDQIEIAEHIGIHKSTMNRQVRRNRGKRGYRYQQAHQLELDRRREKVKLKIDGSTWAFIETLIQNDWSSEQIHGWIKINMNISVSHEWIYQYIFQDKQTGGDLYTYLRCKRRRKKWYGSNYRRRQIKNRVSIDARPSILKREVELETVKWVPLFVNGINKLLYLLQRENRGWLFSIKSNNAQRKQQKKR